MGEMVVKTPEGDVKITNLIRTLREYLSRVRDKKHCVAKLFVSVYLNLEQNPHEDGLIWARWYIPIYTDEIEIRDTRHLSKTGTIEEIKDEAENAVKKGIVLLQSNKILITRISLGQVFSRGTGKYYKYDIENWQMDTNEAFHMQVYTQFPTDIIQPSNLGQDVWTDYQHQTIRERRKAGV